MSDEHVPTPSPHSSARFTTPSAVSPPSANNGVVPKSEEPAPSDSKGQHAVVPEMLMLGRWLTGFLIVAVGGWGFLFLALYLTRSYVKDGWEMAGLITGLLDLVFFLFLERNFWLSRFMGLRIEPGTHAWHSALMLWLLGVPGLLFRSTNFHLQAEAQGDSRTRTQSQPRPRSDSAREIVETIVFVVVLVLLLKSFAAEAFVIPTGSMAQTLLGYQKQVTCPDCGYKFPINCSQEVDPEGGRSSPVYACVCPNCRQQIHFPSAPPALALANPGSREIADPGWNSGDRVLVAKFVYDLFNKDPNRLNVVVFKYPGDDRFPTTGPHRNHVPMNYIKRLIGLSAETIAIRGGDLYYLSPEKSPHYDDYEKAKQNPEMMATLWQKDHMHIDDEGARDRFKKGAFQIIRKDPENILSMMRIVYDNDHPSRLNPASADRWKSADASWKAIAPHGFRHESAESADSARTNWLHYQHLLRDNQGKPALITDIMGYNTYQSASHEHPPLDNNWVGDLILECDAVLDNPQGELTLELAHGVDRFQARWDLSSGTCALFRVRGSGEEKLDSKPTALKKKGTYHLRFANVDQRLVVWVDGDLPFENGCSYAAPAQLGPHEDNDLKKPASIGARGASVSVRKIKLFRDTYYTIGGTKPGTFPHEPDVRIDPADSLTWADMQNPPFVTLYVQPEHFLCLGDNSPESSDGRSWGVVPRRLLLGRALLVYYPFGRAGRIR